MPRWPRIVVGVWAAIGVLSTLWIVHGVSGSGVRLFLLALTAGQAVAGSSAAATILVGLWIQRLRNRPFASSSHRLPAILTGASLTAIALVITAIGWVPELVVLGAFGVALAVVGWKLPPSTGRVVGVLVACIVLVEVPRELGWLGYEVTQSTTSTNTNRDFSHSCTEASLPDHLAIDAKLTGNVGELIASDERGDTRMTVRGAADIHWLTCMLPLVKPVTVHTTLDFEVESPGCSGHGTYVYNSSYVIYGFESCLGARKKMATELRRSLESLPASFR